MNQPFVTVIMPIRNEADYIAHSLSAVLVQDYPHECMEILIADGLSTDGTRSEIVRMAAQHPDIVVKILDNPRQIVPTGLNIALAQAKGDVIIRVDGHTLIAPDYVSACIDALQRSGADNVGGRMTPTSQTAFGQAVAQATSSPFGVGGARFHYSEQEEWVDTVYMGGWPRQVFDRVGLFDEELVRNQDDEFNYRLLSMGGKILLSNKIRSTYYNRSSPQLLWKQYFQYGYWKVRVMQKHPGQMRIRQFVPPLFVAAILGGTVLAPFSRVVRRLWIGVLALYGLVNVAASLRVASRQGWRQVRWLPAVFAILHFSYGLGFLVGLFKFAGRWAGRTGSRT